jgi:CubicO group peptidase (beta-lactamase class C family)
MTFHRKIRCWRRPLLAAACLLVALPLAAPDARSFEPPVSIREQVDEIFSDLDDAVPGAAVIVVRGGTVLFKAAYGSADLRKHTPVATGMAFHLASVGKQMTAVAILQLAEEGKLSVDDPVAKFLPEFRGWGDKVAIRHLLQHTGGLPDTYDALAEMDRIPTNADALKLLARWKRLDFPPGSRQEYSNTGYDVLGALIQKVTGKSYGATMQEHVFAPTGMRNTFTFDEARLAKALRAKGYSQEKKRWVLDDESDLNHIHGSGSIYSTVEDMALYDAALFGGRLIKPASLKQMLTSGHLPNRASLHYGFGWEIDTNADGVPYIGHSGSWMGFTSYYLHDPRTNLSVIVLSNSSESETETLAFETAKVFR